MFIQMTSWKTKTDVYVVQNIHKQMIFNLKVTKSAIKKSCEQINTICVIK